MDTLPHEVHLQSYMKTLLGEVFPTDQPKQANSQHDRGKKEALNQRAQRIHEQAKVE
jgi:hypothetical protein